MPITTNVVSLNPAHDEVYSIQQYEIKLVSDLRLFLLGTPVSSTNKTDRHDITKIVLKVALNTVCLTPSILVRLFKVCNEQILVSVNYI